MKKSEIELIQTCGGCPEQYDAIYKGEVIGYLRLRHGGFSVRYPNSSGGIIYFANPKGDGVFEDDERDKYLNKAKKRLRKIHLKNMKK